MQLAHYGSEPFNLLKPSKQLQRLGFRAIQYQCYRWWNYGGISVSLQQIYYDYVVMNMASKPAGSKEPK